MKVSYIKKQEVERVKEVKGCYECPHFRRTREKDLYYDPFYDTYIYYCGERKGIILGRLSFGARSDERSREREKFGKIPDECPFSK